MINSIPVDDAIQIIVVDDKSLDDIREAERHIENKALICNYHQNPSLQNEVLGNITSGNFSSGFHTDITALVFDQPFFEMQDRIVKGGETLLVVRRFDSGSLDNFHSQNSFRIKRINRRLRNATSRINTAFFVSKPQRLQRQFINKCHKHV